MAHELLPCPFCGSAVIGPIPAQWLCLGPVAARKIGQEYGSAIECVMCEARGPICDDEEQAALHWNAAMRGTEHQQRLVAANRKLLIELHDLRTFGAPTP